MDWETINKRIADFKIDGKKIPFSFYEFDREVEPPHLMATEPQISENFMADNKVLVEFTQGRLELTTDYLDKELEKRIQNEILYDISYQKERAYIPEEHIWNVSFYFIVKGE